MKPIDMAAHNIRVWNPRKSPNLSPNVNPAEIISKIPYEQDLTMGSWV